MKNILFVLYNDFHSQSAIHVHHFANNLITQGLDCVVCVPRDRVTVSLMGKTLYKVTEFCEISHLNDFFVNGCGPDIVHAWTPREVNRIYCDQLRKIYDFKLIIHLEDNEEYILEKDLKKPFKRLLDSVDYLDIPERLSHPTRYRELIDGSDGVTVIIEKLKEFVPDHIPSITLWPGVDTKHFFIRRRNSQLAERLGVPKDSVVFCYTGNVHAGNINEVRSIYLAVALMNREGISSVLIRTGMNTCEFLGADDQWLKNHSIELGYIDYNTMPDILALADVLVQPGRPDKFNDYRFPSKLPEFLAMGKPVIMPSTNIACVMEHQKDAWVLPVADAIHIVDAVKVLLNDTELYGKLSQGAVNFARTHLNWQQNTKVLKSFYEDIWSKKAIESKNNIESESLPPQKSVLFQVEVPNIQLINQPHIQEELEQTKIQLQQVQRELEEIKAQLDQTQAELKQTQTELDISATEQQQSLTQPVRFLDELSKQLLINRYVKPRTSETMGYATVRDFCDSADYLAQMCKFDGDLKNVQRPWIIKTIISQVPLGGKLLEIGGGIPSVAGFLTELGYEVTIVDPYQGDGNGPMEYEKYIQQYPHVNIIKAFFEPNLQGVNPASFDCIFSVSVLEHIFEEALENVFKGISKFLRPRGKSIHCVDHVLQGAGAQEHDENLKVILFNQLKLQKLAYGISDFEGDYYKMMNDLNDDLETYYLSAEGHNMWRGGIPYDVFPFRKVVSIETCVFMS